MSVRRILVLLGVALAVGASASIAQQRDIVGTQKASPAAAAFYTDSWAVIIGINDYQHRRVPKLRYAVNDALAIERALLAQGFRRDRIFTLLDAQATKSAIP